MSLDRRRRNGRKGRRRNLLSLGLIALAVAAIAVGCRPDAKQPQAGDSTPPATSSEQTSQEPAPPVSTPPTPNSQITPPTKTGESGGGNTTTTGTGGDKKGTVASNPTSITVLVNKSIMLPDGYVPADLTEPQVAFIFSEKAEKRLMRAEAARALEQMFAAAKKDGLFLAGVSGYRSYQTQESLFNYYVSVQGEETARRYSAEPGHSEHQTGLAMDVSGSTGYCAADDCFADTPEAKWLAQHAPEYGFIIRYPKGKESITGYAYESWHVRYIGKAMAADVVAKGVTLDEYLGQSTTAKP